MVVRRAAAVTLFISLVVLQGSALAAPPSGALPGEVDLTDPPPPAPDKRLGLSSDLAAVSRIARESGTAPALRDAASRQMRTRGDRIVVIVESTDRPAGRGAVSAARGAIEAEHAGLLQAVIPVTALEAVARAPGVRLVRPPLHARALAVSGQGPTATGAGPWHAAGLRGTGAKVAIIDLGFTGYAARQASGDLPADVTTVDLCSGGLSTETAHGTAVAEIVHEMAPAAQLHLICIGTEVQLGLANEYAKTNGIHVVNHSVGWLNSSRGDGGGAAGTPDAIVADARANGILWVNAAGNEAQRHWSGTFLSADGDGWHDFGPGDEVNAVTLNAGVPYCFFLKWDDWSGGLQDFDLYLVRLADGVLVAGSEDAQPPFDPAEALCYIPPSSGAYGLAIWRFSASLAPRFDLFAPDGPNLEHQVAAGSLLEPATSPHVLAVGAICWQNSALEPYSSRGPTIDGRIKPDLAGQDAVSSATYGPFTTCGASGFTGTSAGSPHVAGAAALVKQANATSSPAAVQSFLEGRAVDLGTAGKDSSFGAGRLALGAAPVIGGRGLGIRTGQNLSWSGGTAQLGYAVVRHHPGGADLLPSAGSLLPSDSTGFADSSFTGAWACYALLPIGLDIQAVSDVVCIARETSSGTFPADFTLRLNQSTSATLTWTPPATHTGFILVIGNGVPAIELPAGSTTTTVPLGSIANCFTLVVMNGATSVGWTDLLCALSGQSTFP